MSSRLSYRSRATSPRPSHDSPSFRPMSSVVDLNISLETHLKDALTPLQPLLPTSLAQTLSTYLSEPSPTIPYQVLQSVSQWSRTSSGLAILCSHSPPLDPHAYSMISLLAGSTTSPERKFPDYVPEKDPEEVEAAKQKERKTITALLNALLSIGGSAAAAWWAADKTGWRNEWRVLLSLFVAIIVATSEAVLYIIWQSRRSTSTGRKARSAIHKKDDSDRTLNDSTESISLVVQEGSDGLRQRRYQPSNNPFDDMNSN